MTVTTQDAQKMAGTNVQSERKGSLTEVEELPQYHLARRSRTYPVASTTRMRANNVLLDQGLKKLVSRTSDPTKPVSKNIYGPIYADAVPFSQSPIELSQLAEFDRRDAAFEQVSSSSPSDRSGSLHSSRESKVSSQRHRSRESAPVRPDRPRSVIFAPRHESRGSPGDSTAELEKTSHREKELLSRVRELEREKAELESGNKKLHELVDRSDAYSAELRHGNEDLKAQLVDSMRQSRSPVFEDDERIRQKLQYCIKQWKGWAYYNAAASLAHVDAAGMDTIKEQLKCYASANKIDHLLELLHRKKARHKMIKSLLFAILTKWLTDFIMERPFFGLSEFRSMDGNFSPSLYDNQSALNNFYIISHAERESSANEWRAKTVTLIEGLRATSIRKDEYYKNLARAFEANWTGILLRDCDTSEAKERYELLCDMISQAGTLFTSLMQQRFRIEIWGASKLCGEALTRTSDCVETADTDTDCSQTPPRHAAKTNDNILMVITPAIVAYGNEKGTNYHQKKVLARALVRTL